MVKKYEIFDEDTFFSLLKQCNSDEGLPDGCQIEFVGWPQFEFTIRGEQFDGGVPTRIMPTIMMLQKQIDVAYARAVHGTIRRLSKKERRETELIVRFEAGRSTTFLSEVWPILNSIAQRAVGKMDGTQAVITILGVAGIFCLGYMFKNYIRSMVELKKLEKPGEFDFAIEVSQKETKAVEMINSLAHRFETVADQLKQQNRFHDEVLKRLAPTDALIVGDTAIDGDTARELVSKPRPEVLESRMDGQFIILTVDSGSVRGGFRLKVRDVEGGNDVTVDVPEGTLSPEQVDILQRGEWGKRPLTMRINTRKAGNRLIGATLVEAGLEQ